MGKRKSQSANGERMLRDKVEWKIATGLAGIQRGWAAFMHRHCERLTMKTKSLVLLSFIILGSAYCSYLIGRGLLDVQRAPRSPGKIQTPVYALPDIAATAQQRKVQQVLQLKVYLDSLSRSPNGKVHYREVLRRYPGLMDSLAAFEKLHRP